MEGSQPADGHVEPLVESPGTQPFVASPLILEATVLPPGTIVWPSRFRPLRRRWALPAIVIAVSVIAVLAVVAPNPFLLSTASGAGSSTGNPTSSPVGAVPLASGGGSVCQQPSRIPSAIDLYNTNPTAPFPVGATITAEYEYEAANYTSALLGVKVFVPVTQALFPTTAGTSVSVTIPANTAEIAGSGWTSPITGTFTATNASTFTTGLSQLATEGYAVNSPYTDAVQAAEPYGNLTLEFSWNWQVTQPGGAVSVGPWTVPTYSGKPPVLPSIFYPAPLVSSVSDTSLVSMGSSFVDRLAGFASNTTFTLTFQTVSGNILGTTQLRTPISGAGPWPAPIEIVTPTNELSPGYYVFHALNRCGAMVQDLWFHVSYPTSAHVGVKVNPSTCGSIKVNGVARPNGATDVLTPSNTSLTLVAPSCAGYGFAGWSSTGGVFPASENRTTTVVVGWNGTLTATYGTGSALTFKETGLGSTGAWNVTIFGYTKSANAGQAIVFAEPGGAYTYSIGADLPGLATPATGTLDFTGTPITTHIVFSAVDITHVVVIYDENQNLGPILAYAPYMDYLWNTYGHVSNFYPVCHPSLADYTSFISGRYFTCGGNLTQNSDQNLPDVLQAAGLTWGGYFESMPYACDPNWYGTIYDTTHNPFLVDEDIVNNVSRCDSHVVNSAAFNTSAAAGNLPSLSLYIPNTQDDCEYSNLPVCNLWLSNFLPNLLNSTNPVVQQEMAHTAFFILFDESLDNLGYSVGGITNSYCTNLTGVAYTACGGLTYMVAVSPYSHGASYTPDATDFNLEETVEWLLGVGNDGGYDANSNFPPMETLFWPSSGF
jgi:hypothetical protein